MKYDYSQDTANEMLEVADNENDRLREDLAETQRKWDEDTQDIGAMSEQIQSLLGELAVKCEACTHHEAFEDTVALREENERLKAILGDALSKGIISIDGVNLVEENAKLRERNKRQHEEIERVVAYSFQQDTELNKLGAENAKLNTQIEEMIKIAAEREEFVSTLKLTLSGKTMCYDPDSYIKGMEEAAEIAFANTFSLMPYAVAQAINARIAELKEVKNERGV